VLQQLPNDNCEQDDEERLFGQRQQCEANQAGTRLPRASAKKAPSISAAANGSPRSLAAAKTSPGLSATNSPSRPEPPAASPSAAAADAAANSDASPTNASAAGTALASPALNIQASQPYSG
jgi:hypothetical protein